MKPTSVNKVESNFDKFNWLYRQGLRVSDKLAVENFPEESRLIFVLSETFRRMVVILGRGLSLLTEIDQRINDPAGMTNLEKEEARRDHVEGDHE